MPCLFHGPSGGVQFNSAALCPTGNVLIVGMGSDQSIIDANLPTTNVGLQTPVMAVARTAAVILRGVTLRGGSNVGLNDSAGRSEGGGGGINNAGTLVLEDSVVTENYTRGVGGGIYNQRNLTLTRTTVSRNIAAGGGGGLT